MESRLKSSTTPLPGGRRERIAPATAGSSGLRRAATAMALREDIPPAGKRSINSVSRRTSHRTR